MNANLYPPIVREGREIAAETLCSSTEVNIYGMGNDHVSNEVLMCDSDSILNKPNLDYE